MSWFREFNKLYGIPDSYVCIDVETSGLKPTDNLLCTFGYAVVQNRQLVDRGLVVLNWFGYPDCNQTGLHDELLKTAQVMREKGKSFYHVPEFLKQNGVPPMDGLQRILQIVQEAERQNMMLVGHNGYHFDCEFLQAHFHDFLQTPWLVGDNGMYDTGMCEKAAQLDPIDSPLPASQETMRAWAKRIGSMRRKGVFWSLDGYVEPRYRIAQRMQLDPSQFHMGDFDAMYLHYVVEEHRRLANETVHGR